jgi:hypothetical protein
MDAARRVVDLADKAAVLLGKWAYPEILGLAAVADRAMLVMVERGARARSRKVFSVSRACRNAASMSGFALRYLDDFILFGSVDGGLRAYRRR